MGLFISQALSSPSLPFDGLLQIVKCDAGIDTREPNPLFLQVIYQPTFAATTPAQQRIYELTKGAMDVAIIGVDSTFTIPGSTAKITKYTGGAVQEPTADAPYYAVWLDITDGGGGDKYYVVHDTDGQAIFEPREVILYHELSHAYHLSKGDAPADDKGQEIQAISDENTFRALMGLPARHATDHWGMLGMPAHGGVNGISRCTSPFSGINLDCIVATAAVGSPQAPQVAELRRKKHEYRSLSLWAAMIAEPALKLYGMFSPQVVRDMNGSPALRGAMRLYAVLPVFYLVQVAETYLAAEADSAELGGKLGLIFDRYLDDFGTERRSAPALKQAADGALAASRLLTAGDAGPARAPEGEPMAGALFPYLAAAIGSTGGPAGAFAWALEGISLFLAEAAARLERRGTADSPAFLSILGAWVARLPMPPADRLRLSDASRELSVLAARIFKHPELRGLFAQHLAGHWPAASAPALLALLRDAGYSNPGRGR
jgi:hypothetical protein